MFFKNMILKPSAGIWSSSRQIRILRRRQKVKDMTHKKTNKAKKEFKERRSVKESDFFVLLVIVLLVGTISAVLVQLVTLYYELRDLSDVFKKDVA